MTQLSYLSLTNYPLVSADVPHVSRRAAISSAAVGMTSLSGCLGRIWSTWERDTPSQISVEIRTAPDDDDLYAMRIARHLAENFESVGIQADVSPMRQDTFLREVLINHNFDIFVWRHPAQRNTDELLTLLHSQFAEERGWQNPYGYSNSIVDGLLESQRSTHEEDQRLADIDDLLDILVNERPYIPLVFEEEHRLINHGRVQAVSNEPFEEPTWLYGLDVEAGESITLGSNDGRLTRNLNPISVEFRGYSGVIGLMYEPIAQHYDDRFVPWLSSGWEWTSPSGARMPTLELELREDLLWHDDERVTADDVVFTYEFLQDTSRAEDDPIIPTPRFRGRSSLLESAEAVDERTVRLQFTETTPDLAIWLLTIPILPAHIWEELATPTEVAGIPIDEVTTDALIEDNLEPIGSGPYQIRDVSTDDYIELELIEDHPFVVEDVTDRPIPELAPPNPAALEIDIRPSVTNISDSIRDGGLDGSIVGLGPHHVHEGSQDEGITGITQATQRLYHVGFNVREGPALSHAGFRTAVEPLLDREFIQEDIFGGAGQPTRSGISDKHVISERFAWAEADIHQFAGEPGTGEVEPEYARDAFREAGFSFSADGDLLIG